MGSEIGQRCEVARCHEEAGGSMTDPTGSGQSTIEDVRAELHAKGYRWHYFGPPPKVKYGAPWVSPSERHFWFNGSTMGDGPGRLVKQPFGWFTLDEMLDEKFAEGCR